MIDRKCNYCDKLLSKRDLEYPSAWVKRKNCGRRCADLGSVSETARLRGVKMALLYKTGLYTLSEVGEMSGGISGERVRQILQKTQDLIPDYRLIVVKNRQLSMNRLLKTQGRREIIPIQF